ncbi:MAG: DUF3962 domain-containing protein [Okeania sp. SIO3B3]|nr:DUF3962 domain-containing protein [Okeania sp. SIO3B3]
MSEELRELIYTIVENSEQFFDNYYSLSFPKQWLSELNNALSLLKKRKKVKRTTTIPIDSLNATLKATASLIQVSKGITKDHNSSPLWLLTTGKEINIKSLRRILQIWAKYHFQQRWEYDDVQDLIKSQSLEDLNWVPCSEATLFDWETNPETRTATPRDYNAFQVLADIIASKITETPLKIGVKERQFFKGPNIGEVVEWPPQTIYQTTKKGTKVVGWVSVFIQVTVQQRYFNSHPFIQLHTGVRRFTNNKNFSPASRRKANLHFQTKPDYWCEGFPIKNSIQSVAIKWFKKQGTEDKYELKFSEHVAEILKLLGKDFINPNAKEIIEPKKIIDQIPEIIPETPENVTILFPYSTTLKNPSSIPIKNGLFFHDRYIIDLAIKDKFAGRLKPTEILNPYQSDIKSEITKDDKNLAELIRRKYPNKIWMGLSSFSEEIKKGIKLALTELQLLDSENSPINFEEIEENVTNTLGAALDENGEDGRKNYIAENLSKQTEQNPGAIIIHTFDKDYAEYKDGKDPKKINRKSFCPLNIVSQFIVKDGAKQKYKNAILDAIRQLGITYPKKYQQIILPDGKKFEVPENLTFVGLRMLRITGKTAFDNKAKSLPVFVKISNQTGEVEFIN